MLYQSNGSSEQILWIVMQFPCEAIRLELNNYCGGVYISANEWSFLSAEVWQVD